MAKNKLVEPTIEEPTAETPMEINVVIDAPVEIVETVEAENNQPGVNTRAYRS